MNAVNSIKKLVPMSLRKSWNRLKRTIRNTLHPLLYARDRITDVTAFPVCVAERKSLLLKTVPPEWEIHQRNKITTLRLASGKVNGIVIQPGEVFSFWRMVGKPSARKGYLPGMEVNEGQLVETVAGGICQLSNALCWCTLNAGMEIVERHRHAYDLFPDDRRDVPFGSGATVLYNYLDFIFRNTSPYPVLIRAEVIGDYLQVGLYQPSQPDYTVEIIEANHGFERMNGTVYRRNEIVRVIRYPDGNTIRETVFQNHAQVLYDVEI